MFNHNTSELPSTLRITSTEKIDQQQHDHRQENSSIHNNNSTIQRQIHFNERSNKSDISEKPSKKNQSIVTPDISKYSITSIPSSRDDEEIDHKYSSRSPSPSPSSSDENVPSSPVDKALLELAPRKAKKMFNRRKIAHEKGLDVSAGLWDSDASSVKPQSLKQIQRLSGELEQVLAVLCNGDKNVASDVLTHLITRRHLKSDIYVNVEKNFQSMSERSLDSKIVDGIKGFLNHNHTRGTRTNEAARAVDAVLVASCFDICDEGDDESYDSSQDASANKKKGQKRKFQTDAEKKVSTSALIDRLQVNRCAVEKGRERAKTMRAEKNCVYTPIERKSRKDKGVRARLYREVRKLEQENGVKRKKSEYDAIDALHSICQLPSPDHSPDQVTNPTMDQNMKSNHSVTRLLSDSNDVLQRQGTGASPPTLSSISFQHHGALDTSPMNLLYPVINNNNNINNNSIRNQTSFNNNLHNPNTHTHHKPHPTPPPPVPQMSSGYGKDGKDLIHNKQGQSY